VGTAALGSIPIAFSPGDDDSWGGELGYRGRQVWKHTLESGNWTTFVTISPQSARCPSADGLLDIAAVAFKACSHHQGGLQRVVGLAVRSPTDHRHAHFLVEGFFHGGILHRDLAPLFGEGAVDLKPAQDYHPAYMLRLDRNIPVRGKRVFLSQPSVNVQKRSASKLLRLPGTITFPGLDA
jgi:hypothetical protein